RGRARRQARARDAQGPVHRHHRERARRQGRPHAHEGVRGGRVMSRLAAAFSKRPALVAYVMAGEPDLQSDIKYARAALAEADALEIGVPFSDPVADGPTIERAHTRALARGATLAHALALARALRRESDKPLLLMTYYNPVLQRGLDKFAAEAREAGVDGVILPDCPLEESGPAGDALGKAGVDLIQLASPATPPERMTRLARATRGFLYVISSYGVTGARASGEDARALTSALDAWVGPELPFWIIVDMLEANNVTLAWRLDWANWCASRASRVHAAFFQVPEDTMERVLLFERLAKIK